MNRYFLIFVSILITLSCSSVKKTEKALNTGNYDEAISIAINKLRTNKDKKGKQPYIEMLKTAFDKATARDQSLIRFLEKENNPANLDRIYKSYRTLKNRQERINPLLPLHLPKSGRKIPFDFVNYETEILASKKALSTYLYESAGTLLQNAKVKYDYRDAYEDLAYLNEINPNYKNSVALMEEAHYKGTDFVIVSMKNKTNKVIPKRLEADLLNFDTYGLNNLWTVYHSTKQRDTKYDFGMELAFKQINISPEQIKERQLEREKEIVDGWEYVTDGDGKIVVDDEGNKIKQDVIITVFCEYYEFTQFKAVNVIGNVRYKNLRNNKILDNFPLSSEFVFENRYANFKGDRRALDRELRTFIGARAIDFPTNEQMVYDSGEDIKNKLKGIISKYRF